jgi:hypothetical protein
MKKTGLLTVAFLISILYVNAQNARPKMAIEYFAEFNLAGPQQFGESHAKDEGYKFSRAETRFTSERKKLCPDGYHIPTIEEWRGIIGEIPKTERWKNTGLGGIPFSRQNFMPGPVLSDVEETIQVGLNEPAKNYLSDYYITGATKFIVYALRFKPDGKSTTDNKMLTAYRYVLSGMIKDNPDAVEKQSNYRAGPAFRFQVTARYLGEEFQGSITDIAKEEYWNNNKTQDVTRIFSSGVSIYSYTEMGMYWSSSEGFDGGRYFSFKEGEGTNAGTYGSISNPNIKLFVRCVCDK